MGSMSLAKEKKMLEEDVAKKKVCPFLFGKGLDKCLASGCMAWMGNSTDNGPATHGYCVLIKARTITASYPAEG